MDHLGRTNFVVNSVAELSELVKIIAAAFGIERVFLGTGNPCYDPYVMHRHSHGTHDEADRNWNVESVHVCPDGDFPYDNQRTFHVFYPR